MQNNIIEVKNLREAYKNVEVLKGMNFSVEQGKTFALLGSNGAGKTTAIKILSTLLFPDSGTATVFGHNVMKQPGKVRAAISLTGQYAAVDEILTGRENLILIAKLRHLKNPYKIADALLSRFELSGAAGRRVSTLNNRIFNHTIS